MTVGLVTSPLCLAHDTGPGHPECAARLTAVLDRLRSDGLSAELDEHVASLAPLAALERVHPGAYVEHVRETIESGSRYVDSSDANVSAASYDAARAASGGLLDATERVLAGTWSSAFVATRPPGHHAEESFAMGFCLFNSVVVAVRAAQAAGLERVAIIDWDVHHGNGTQHLTEHDPSLFYASLHQSPHYPGTGAASERGLGDGEGSVLNCPQAPGSGDREWLGDFEGRVLPAVEEFAPDLILISAGFDAHQLDPLSETQVGTDAFRRMTEGVLEVADRTCGGKLVAVLEGGYSLEGLSASASAHVAALLAHDS